MAVSLALVGDETQMNLLRLLVAIELLLNCEFYKQHPRLTLFSSANHQEHKIMSFTNYNFFVSKKMPPNFLDLATTLKNLGARWLLEKKVNFVP